MTRDTLTDTHFNQKVSFHSAVNYTIGGYLIDASLAARLTGALDGARITLTLTETDGVSKASFVVHHEFFEHPAEREIQSYEGGYIMLSNIKLTLKSDYRGQRLGLRMFAHEAYAALQVGVSQIWMFAAGNSKSDKYNGYYTWARCGFDALLEPADIEKLPQEFQNCATVQALMVSPQGRAHWQQHGTGRMMCFDVDEESTSWKALGQYLAESEVSI